MKALHLPACATALALLLPATASAQSCDRACLGAIMDSYFDALTRNEASGLPMASEARVSQNNQWVEPAATLWETAEEVSYRWDIANPRTGDTAALSEIRNSDGSKTMLAVRLKVQDGRISELETVKANEGDADRLWGNDYGDVPPALTLSLPVPEQNLHYELIAAAESYWYAFQTNGTPDYRPAWLLPTAQRYENGLHTTGMVRNGNYVTAASGFDQGRFIGRNIWDRRYPVVDSERGIVLSIVRFGLKTGMESQSVATSNPRLVAEFFAVKAGKIDEIHAVLFNVPEEETSVWEPEFGPPQGGWE